MDAWIILCRTQIHMTNLQIQPLDRPYMSILSQISSLVKACTKVSTLSLFATSLDILKAFQKVLQVHSEIETLKLVFTSKPEQEVDEDFADSSDCPGLICRTIFSHLMPFSGDPPIRLRSLELDSMEVGYADRHLLRAISVEALRNLEVRDCRGADRLFSHLSQSPHLPVHLNTLCWANYTRVEDHILQAFEGFLEALPALEGLHVMLGRTPRLPKMNAISRFGSKLVSLLVHCHTYLTVQMLCYGAEDLRELCTSCTSIRELSVALPYTELLSETALSSQWKPFLVSSTLGLVTASFLPDDL